MYVYVYTYIYTHKYPIPNTLKMTPTHLPLRHRICFPPLYLMTSRLLQAMGPSGSDALWLLNLGHTRDSSSLTQLQSPPGITGKGPWPSSPYDSGPCCCPDISVPCPSGPPTRPLTTWKLAFLPTGTLRSRDGSQSSCHLTSGLISHHSAMFSPLEVSHQGQWEQQGRKPG